MNVFFTRRFCSHLGTLFTFVVNDIQDKIEHLQSLMTVDEQNFSTVQNMILYEKSNKKIKGYCGSITLLRLHRGLGNTSKLSNSQKKIYQRLTNICYFICFRIHYSVHV